MAQISTPAAHTNGHQEQPPPLRVFLQPIAPPVTLGLWGFFGSTMVISTWILGWWGDPTSPTYFFAFNCAFGGIAQFAAGIYSFKARDYIASSLLTMWGTYWMAYGFLVGLSVAGFYKMAPLTAPQPAFAVWFIPLGIFTLTGAVAALSPKAGNFPLFALLLTVGVGCAFVTGGFWTGGKTWIDLGAWFFIFGAGFAWYVATMTLMTSSWRRVILPLGKFRTKGNIPGETIELPSEYEHGEPGVRQGQL